MTFEYTVTETITRIQAKIDAISYEFEALDATQATFGIAKSSEKRSRIFEMTVTREQYNQMARQHSNLLPFDNFILVLRPFMMGFYQNNELEQAFNILDSNKSGQINLEQLGAFLPIITENVTINDLKNYIEKVNLNNIERLTYDDFRTLTLKGIGRDIICHHI